MERSFCKVLFKDSTKSWPFWFCRVWLHRKKTGFMLENKVVFLFPHLLITDAKLPMRNFRPNFCPFILPHSACQDEHSASRCKCHLLPACGWSLNVVNWVAKVRASCRTVINHKNLKKATPRVQAATGSWQLQRKPGQCRPTTTFVQRAIT